MSTRDSILPRIAAAAATLWLGAVPGPALAGFLPDCLLGLDASRSSHALVVEKETEKLFLFEGRGDEPPALVRTWNATTGQNAGDKVSRGDLKTPEGIYFFTRVIEDFLGVE